MHALLPTKVQIIKTEPSCRERWHLKIPFFSLAIRSRWDCIKQLYKKRISEKRERKNSLVIYLGTHPKSITNIYWLTRIIGNLYWFFLSHYRQQYNTYKYKSVQSHKHQFLCLCVMMDVPLKYKTTPLVWHNPKF